MALVDTLYAEIMASPKDEINARIDNWVKRCRTENISVHALDSLLRLRGITDSGTRNIFRFSHLSTETATIEITHTETTSVDNNTTPVREGFFTKLKRLFSK